MRRHFVQKQQMLLRKKLKQIHIKTTNCKKYSKSYISEYWIRHRESEGNFYQTRESRKVFQVRTQSLKQWRTQARYPCVFSLGLQENRSRTERRKIKEGREKSLAELGGE